MDFLKAAIASIKQKISTNATTKRKADDADGSNGTGSASAPAVKKFKTRGEIEAERKAKLQAEQEERARKRAAAEAATSYTPRDRRVDSAAAASSISASASPSPSPDELLVTANEVKRRLRSYAEPITLFGESDFDRYTRLKHFELQMHDRATSSMGAKNAFRDILKRDVESEIKAALMRDLEAGRKGEEEEEEKKAGEKDGSAAASASPDAASSSTSLAALAASDSITEAGTELDETGRVIKRRTGGSDYRHVELTRDDFDSAEEFVLYFLRRMLGEWEEELENRPKEVRMSERGKMASAIQKQTRLFLKPLIKLLKARAATPDILNACEKMVMACLDRDYKRADESYLTMAIGNAPWPMGVTMVSIHDRAGREKIFSNQVAHVLNDETQRKYIQSIKRLMTYCQEHYPPSSGSGSKQSSA